MRELDEDIPKFEDADILFVASRLLVDYFVRVRKFERANQYVYNMHLISQKMLELKGTNLDYLRWSAESQRSSALIEEGLDERKSAAASVDSFMEIHHQECQRVGVRCTRQLRDALTWAVEVGARVGIPAESAQAVAQRAG